MKDCEVIADRLSEAGWRCGCISSTDHKGRQFWVVAAERQNAGRFIVRADEMLTAFVELESRLEMKIARRASRHSHFYRCATCGQLVDKRELRGVISTRQITSLIRASLEPSENAFARGAGKFTVP